MSEKQTSKFSFANEVSSFFLVAAGLAINVAAHAGITVNGTSSVSVRSGSELNINCGSLSLNDTSTLLVEAGATLANTGEQTIALTATFTQDGTTNSCRPTFSKVFLPSEIQANDVSTLTYTLRNQSDTAATGIGFTENFANTVPANAITIAPAAQVTNTCGSGTVTAPDSGSQITVSGVSLAANSDCTVFVSVTSSTVGTLQSESSALVSSLGETGSSTSQLTVTPATLALNPPTLSKRYEQASVGLGMSVDLIYTLVNPNASSPVRELSFVETLPSNLVLANDLSSANTTCGTLSGDSGSIVGTAGSGTITFSGFELSAAQSCVIQVGVTSATAGSYSVPEADLQSDQGTSTAFLSSTALTVTSDAVAVSKAFSPSIISVGERSRMTFTFDNSANTNTVYFLDLKEKLPFGLVVATPANVVNACQPSFSPTISAPEGGRDISYFFFNFSLPLLGAGSTCSVSFDIEAKQAGTYLTSTNVESNVGFATQPIGKTSATLTVRQQDFGFVQTFTNDPVAPGGLANLEYSLTNLNRTEVVSDFGFSTDFGSVISGAIVESVDTNQCGSASGLGTGVLSIGSVVLSPAQSCKISVGLRLPTSTPQGEYPVTINGGMGFVGGDSFSVLPITSSLFVDSLPVVTMAYDPAVVSFEYSQGSQSRTTSETSLDVTLTNPNASIDLTDVSIEISFPFEIEDFVGAEVKEGDCGAGLMLDLSPRVNRSSSNGESDPATVLVTGVSLAATAAQPCTLSVTPIIDETASSGTVHTNLTRISATIAGNTESSVGNVSADLEIIAGPELTQSLASSVWLPGETQEVEYTISASSIDSGTFTDIGFSVDTQAALNGLIASNLPLNDVCGVGSTVTLDQSTNGFTFAGGTLSSDDSCAFKVLLDVPQSAQVSAGELKTSPLTAEIDAVQTNSKEVSSDFTISGLLLEMDYVEDVVVPGEILTQRFTIQNRSAVDAISSLTFLHDFGQVLGQPDLVNLNGNSLTDFCGNGSIMSLTNSFFFFTNINLDASEACTFELQYLVPANTVSGNFTGEVRGIVAFQNASQTVLPSVFSSLEISAEALVFEKTFSNNPVVAGGEVIVDYSITNTRSEDSVEQIAFSDDFAGVIPGVSFVSNSQVNVCGSGSALSNTNPITLSGATLAAGDTCSFSVTLALPANQLNLAIVSETSELLGQSNNVSVTGGTAQDVLLVQPVALTQTVTNTSGGSDLFPGDTLRVSYTLHNLSSTESVVSGRMGTNFEAALPGLIATNLPQANVCGLGSSASGTSIMLLQDVALAPDASCTFDVDLLIPANAVGKSYTLRSGNLEQQPTTTLASSVATEFSLRPSPPLFSKEFIPDTLASTRSGVIRYIINNSASSTTLNDLSFSDTIDGGVVAGAVATGLPLNGVCGLNSSVAGTSTIQFSADSLAAGETCTVDVPFTVPQTTLPGMYLSTSTTLQAFPDTAVKEAASTLTIAPSLPTISLQATPSLVLGGGDSSIAFTLSNGVSAFDVSNLTFSLNLPIGVSVSSNASTSTNCPHAAFVATSSTAVTFSSGALTAGASCGGSFNVTGGSSSGTFTLSSTDLTSTAGNSGSATTLLTVDADRDNDGVDDIVDNCPDTMNNDQADLDLDGLGNLCDDDMDGDGMPNDWETANGLNPLSSFDQLADPDFDGFTNLQEYQFNTDPNVANQDLNANGIPDITDRFRAQSYIVPAIILPLILEEATPL